MAEIKFLMTMMIFFGFVTLMLGLALPTLGREFEEFSIPDFPEAPVCQGIWCIGGYAEYSFRIIGYYFSLVFVPTLPPSYRFLNFIFVAFGVVMGYIVIMLLIEIVKAIGGLIPTT